MAGVVGIGSLCHPSIDLIYVPKCTSVQDGKRNGLRATKQAPTSHENKDDKLLVRRLSDDAEEHEANFYIANIGGTIIRYVLVCQKKFAVHASLLIPLDMLCSILLVALIAGMFLGFLTLDAMDLRIKMQAAVGK